MKRFHIVGMSLIAVLAFCVVGVASAGALTTLLAEWLNSGAAITASTAVTTTGKLLLEDSNAEKLGIKAAVECEGTLVGTVNANGADTVTEVLNAKGEAINKTALTQLGLECKNETSCEGTSLVWAVNLPWNSTLELVEQESKEFFADVLRPGASGKNPGWYVECTVIGVKATDECTAGEAASEVIKGTGGTEGIFSEAFRTLMGLPKATCTSSGEASGIVIGSGTTKLASGTLEASE